MKRRSEEPGDTPKTKNVKTDQPGASARPGPPANRFQLSAKGSAGQKAANVPNRPLPKPTTPSSPQKPSVKTTSKPQTSSSPAPTANANGASAPKRGFASIMAKAQAAQEAANAAGSSAIKHKPVEKLTRRERLRMAEEQKAAAKGGKGAGAGARGGAHGDRSRSGTPNAPAGQKKKAPELSYKGTMKNPASTAPTKPAREPLSYKGTARKSSPATAAAAQKKKRLQDDKYSGYVSWSDLDDAEDDEGPDDYESDVSSDMEGGFDDVEKEEQSALRAARKEDQEALEEEERLKREKEARKKRLQMLNKSAAGKRKF